MLDRNDWVRHIQFEVICWTERKNHQRVSIETKVNKIHYLCDLDTLGQVLEWEKFHNLPPLIDKYDYISNNGESFSQIIMWRTLVRITEVKNGKIYFILPSWTDRDYVFNFPFHGLPEWLQRDLEHITNLPYRCYVRCNLGHLDPSKLIFEDWEA